MFTDIEGSTRLAQQTSPDEFQALMEAHNTLVGAAIVGNEGTVIRTEGDSFFAVFTSGSDAVSAAVATQRALANHGWPQDHAIRVRVGIHTGEGRLGGADYIGFDVHRAARISATAHGGQVVVSADTASLARRNLPNGATLTDLGRHRLKDLIAPEHLHQVTIDGMPDEFPPLRTSPVSPHKLPVRLTSFVGRTNELADAVATIRRQRLLTLTGPGGTGKTRLAEEVATNVADDFEDGAFFVPLADLRDPDLLAPAILERLDVSWSRDSDPAPQLVRHLEGKHALLVLDNFEQLLDAAPTVANLLAALPRLSIVATSRSPLRISGEHEYPVAPLSTPPLEAVGLELLANESIALFVDRARSVDPDFEVSDRNAAAVARIANRLDGLPLGIELVAARVKAMPPKIAADMLDGRLVAGGGRDIPERQRTLANTIAWSYDLLEPSQRRFFENLGVFAGGATLDQIEAVNSELDEIEVWEMLAALVDSSLVTRRDAHGEPHFRMLVLVAEDADRRLAIREDAAEIHDRHAAAYTALAERAAPQLTGPRRAMWLQLIAEQHPNLLAAYRWTVTKPDTDGALRLVAAMWRFWQMDGQLDAAAERVEAALALDGGTPEARAKALEAAGGIAYWRGDFDRQFDHYTAALATWRELAVPTEVANALYNLAYVTQIQIGFEAANALLVEAEEIYEASGDRVGLGHVHWSWGNIYQMDGDLDRAIASCQRSIEFFDPKHDIFDLGWAEYVLADCLLNAGRIDEARHHLRAGMDLFIGVGDLSATVLFLAGFAQLTRKMGDVDSSAHLVGAMQALRHETGAGILDTDPAHQPLERLSRTDDQQRQAMIAAGAAMTVDEAIALALERTAR